MHDIVDWIFYQNLLKQETDLFITLTMSVDGVESNKSSDSLIWSMLIVVNEIRRGKKYSLENVMGTGVRLGLKKPLHDNMVNFLQSRLSALVVTTLTS